jgi:hypothetical protein
MRKPYDENTKLIVKIRKYHGAEVRAKSEPVILHVKHIP